MASEPQWFPLNLFPIVLRSQLPGRLCWLYVLMRVLGVQTWPLMLAQPSLLATEPSLQPQDTLHIELCGTHSNPSEPRFLLAL